MTDLRVDSPALATASASVLRAASGVRLDAEFLRPTVDAVGSDAVERVLRLASQQQSQRASIAADMLARVGSVPHAAIDAFAAADRALARAF